MPHYVTLMRWTSKGVAGLPAWRERVETALGLLRERFSEGRSGIVLEHVAGGWAFRASREAAEACARLFEQPADVMPFLENVTRGRGIPRERLESVAEHYLHFGGRSPINDQNRALLARSRPRRSRSTECSWCPSAVPSSPRTSCRSSRT